MADQRISELTAVVTAVGTDQFAVNQGSVSKRLTLSQVKTFVYNDIPNLGAVAELAGNDSLVAYDLSATETKKATMDTIRTFVFKDIPSLTAIDAVADTDSFGMYDLSNTNPRKASVSQVKARILNGGVTSDYTVVTDLNKAGSMLQKKTRLITMTNGLVTTIGDESDWIDVGEFGGGYY